MWACPARCSRTAAAACTASPSRSPRDRHERAVQLITATDAVPESPARVEPPTRAAVAGRAGAAPLAPGPGRAPGRAGRGRAHGGRRGRAARVPAGADALAVLRDHARTARAPPARRPSRCRAGRPTSFAAELAAETGVPVHASLYEQADDGRARVQHRDLRRARRRAARPDAQDAPPRDRGLLRGPLLPARRQRLSRRRGRPTRSSASRRAGTSGSPRSPRAYSLHGAEVIVYPTAIGSEPDHPGFDTEPLWEQVIRAHGITQRHVHGRAEPHRHRGTDHVLRLVVRQRPLRARARAGAARRAGGARRRPRPRSAPRLARAVPVPHAPAAPTPTVRWSSRERRTRHSDGGPRWRRTRRAARSCPTGAGGGSPPRSSRPPRSRGSRTRRTVAHLHVVPTRVLDGYGLVSSSDPRLSRRQGGRDDPKCPYRYSSGRILSAFSKNRVLERVPWLAGTRRSIARAPARRAPGARLMDEAWNDEIGRGSAAARSMAGSPRWPLPRSPRPA